LCQVDPGVPVAVGGVPAVVAVERTLGQGQFGFHCSAARIQCVVARRPSSSPAFAKTKAPAQIDTIGVPRACASAIAATSSVG